MISISYEINGKKVNPRNMKNALEAAILSGVADSVKKSVGSIRCSEHGKSPSIKVKGKNLDSLSLEVNGCCEALIDQVKNKLK